MNRRSFFARTAGVVGAASVAVAPYGEPTLNAMDITRPACPRCFRMIERPDPHTQTANVRCDCGVLLRAVFVKEQA